MTYTELADVLFAFEHFYYLDKSNAPIHCAPVRFSPITFRLARILAAYASDGDDITAELAEVRAHDGAYELDHGR